MHKNVAKNKGHVVRLSRFYIIRVPSPPSAVSLFVYLCPDSAAVRRKMTLSSAKVRGASASNLIILLEFSN